MITFFFVNIIKKKLVRGLKSNGGRNFLGRVCFRGQGGGNKKLYRFIDFYRRLNQFGKIYKIFKDPNRNSRIGLVIYANGLSSFLIIQKNMKINTIIYSGSIYDLKEGPIINGFSLPIQYMPLFSTLSNIEQRPFEGGLISRAANVGSILTSKNNIYGFLKLNSGWQIKISINCIASMGAISDSLKCYESIGKAGKNRSLGNKPKVRGVAKNPCDHPHGGGNGKKSKPMIPTNA
jgi:large subunit ribosomal protein L2